MRPDLIGSDVFCSNLLTRSEKFLDQEILVRFSKIISGLAMLHVCTSHHCNLELAVEILDERLLLDYDKADFLVSSLTDGR